MRLELILTEARNAAVSAGRKTARLSDLSDMQKLALAEATLKFLRSRPGKPSTRPGWTEVSAGSAGVMPWWADALGEPLYDEAVKRLRPLRREIYDLLEDEYELIQKAPGQGSSVHVSSVGSVSDAADNALAVVTVSDAGAGYGTPEHNRLVETAAMRAAITAFAGWDHVDVSDKKCGWDITFRRGSEELHAEVKGVSGSKPSVLLTANEWRRAADDENWKLVIVTHALLTEPRVIVVDRGRITNGATPYVYRFTSEA
jgi:hypothetical protein